MIRNFSIIAHIDHGKSTLADRLLEYTGAISPREFRDQVLDSLPMERERGITIKAHTVRFRYTAKDGQPYTLNLIDTPGHVDFNYEVSRALAACEGALLVVDASQGVEAQTLANAHLAEGHGLAIVPVINKIDLQTADVQGVKRQIQEALGLDADEAILTSAKEGIGTLDVLEAICHRIPPPSGRREAPLRALVFDSWYDPYQGVIVLVRLADGVLAPGQTIQMMSTGHTFEVQEVGVLAPQLERAAGLEAGEVGYLIAGIKRLGETRIGDTITEAARPAAQPLPGYRDVKPMVFCGLYAVAGQQPEAMRDALEKLRLNDTAFTFEPETSLALGFGFRCGFLGLLHMEIVRERLEREYRLSLIMTTPTVVYRVTTRAGATLRIDNPAHLPPANEVARFEEPIMTVTIVSPQEYIGPILQLCQERRGLQRDLKYLETKRVVVRYDLPLNEMIQNFYDRLKTLSRGYASLDYEFLEQREADLCRVDILINGETVDALSFIAPRERAITRGRQITERLRDVIPRQLFEVAIQAAVGGRIVARETVRALRKNVTAKCYGGDITRKRKLWEKQREGKKRMKQLGRVEIPQEAFLAVLTLPT